MAIDTSSKLMLFHRIKTAKSAEIDKMFIIKYLKSLDQISLKIKNKKSILIEILKLLKLHKNFNVKKI